MIIKRGNIVCHSGATTWGVGKVVEVTPIRATILFCDGTTRKITSSYYHLLQPSDPGSYVPMPETIPVVKPRATAKKKATIR